MPIAEQEKLKLLNFTQTVEIMAKSAGYDVLVAVKAPTDHEVMLYKSSMRGESFIQLAVAMMTDPIVSAFVIQAMSMIASAKPGDISAPVLMPSASDNPQAH